MNNNLPGPEDRHDNRSNYLKDILSSSRTFLMGIAMISIVLFHERLLPILYFTTAFRLYSWGVQIFFFLSGLGCAYAMGKYTATAFYRRRLARIIPTCLIVGIAILAVEIYNGQVEITWIDVMFRLLGQNYWFIQVILALYLLIPLFYIVIKKWKATGLFCLAAVDLALMLLFPDNMSYFCSYYTALQAPAYLAGLYVGIHDFRLSRWQLPASIATCALAMYIRLAHYTPSWEPLYIITITLTVPGLCLALVWLRQYCVRLRLNGIIEAVGAYSLEIYVIHEYVLHTLQRVTLAPSVAAPYECLIKVIAFLTVTIIACLAVRSVTRFITSGLGRR